MSKRLPFPQRLDLPQVNLVNFRVEFVRFLREQARKSREVDLSRLKSFRFRFEPKMRSGLTCNWCLRLPLEILELKDENISAPLRPKQSNMCASLNHRKSKFVYSVLK